MAAAVQTRRIDASQKSAAKDVLARSPFKTFRRQTDPKTVSEVRSQNYTTAVSSDQVIVVLYFFQICLQNLLYTNKRRISRNSSCTTKFFNPHLKDPSIVPCLPPINPSTVRCKGPILIACCECVSTRDRNGDGMGDHFIWCSTLDAFFSRGVH